MVKFGENVFNADVEENKEYYLNNQLCDCLACKNYYAVISRSYPKLASFLREFGVDATRPDELSWVGESFSQHTVFYEAMYTVKGYPLKGDISQLGREKINIDNADIYFGECDFPNNRNTKCFGIHIAVILNWEQEESYDDWFCNNQKGIMNRIFRKGT